MASEIWHNIIDKLNKAKLDYLLAGDAALAVHGLLRSTLDMDIYIIAKTETLNKLFHLAASLGKRLKIQNGLQGCTN